MKRIEIVHLSALITSICALSEQVCRLLSFASPTSLSLVSVIFLNETASLESRRAKEKANAKRKREREKNHRLTYESAPVSLDQRGFSVSRSHPDPDPRPHPSRRRLFC